MMTAVQEKKILTAEEYLKMEREGIREKDGKYEFFNQKLIFMAGASNIHNLITKNLIFALELQVRNNHTNHSIYSQDMRTISHIPGKNYFYPDIEIVEGISYFDDDFKDVLINPTLIVEVLSESTESFDRGDKFKSYRNISSFREYILVSQQSPCIEQFYKNEQGKWEIGDITTEGILKLKSLPFELNIEDIYFKIDFTTVTP